MTKDAEDARNDKKRWRNKKWRKTCKKQEIIKDIEDESIKQKDV